MEPTTQVTVRPCQPAELSHTERYESRRSSLLVPEAKEEIFQSSFVGVDCTKTVVVKETKLAQNPGGNPPKSSQETPPKWMKTTDPNNKGDCDDEPKQSKDCELKENRKQELNTFEATSKSDTENEVKPAKPKWKRPEGDKEQTGQVLNGPNLNSSQEIPKVLQKQPKNASKVSTETVSSLENKGDCDAEPEQSKDCGLKENKKPQLNTFDAPLTSHAGNEVKPAKPKWKRPAGVKEQTGQVLNGPKLSSSQNKKLDTEMSQESPIVLQKPPDKVSKVSTNTVSSPANKIAKSPTKPIELDMKASMNTSGILDTKSKGTVSNLNVNNSECTKKVSEPATKLSDELESNSRKPVEKGSSLTKKSKKASTKAEDIKASSLPAKCDEVPSKQSLKKSPKECQDKMPMQQSPATNRLEITKIGEESGKKTNNKFEAREGPKMKEETENIDTKSQKSSELQIDIPKNQPDPIALNIENNPLTEELQNSNVGEEEEVEEDASGMRAMRKEVGCFLPELNNFVVSSLILGHFLCWLG